MTSFITDIVIKMLRPIFYVVSQFIAFVARYTYPFIPIPPLRLNIMATRKCNLSCNFCHVIEGLNDKEENNLSLDEWDLIIDKIPRSTCIDFTGGEVFLMNNIRHILKGMLKKKLIVSVISNGTAVSKKDIDFLIEGGLAYFMFSLDGMESYHDTIRGKKGTFKSTVELIKYIQKKKKELNKKFPIVCVKSVILGTNTEELTKLIPFVDRELEVENYNIGILYDSQYREGYQLFSDFEQVDLKAGNRARYEGNSLVEAKKALDFILEYKEKAENSSITIAPKLKDESLLYEYLENPKKFNKKKCNLPWSEFSLRYDGEFYSCITYKSGNIRNLNYDVNKVIRSAGYRKLLDWLSIQGAFPPVCEGCCRVRHEKVS